jgi:hypothetical protein
MARIVTAKQLIDKLALCTVCGKEHKPRKVNKFHAPSWAASDGHSYRMNLYVLTGSSSTDFIQKLRDLTESMK